MNTAEFGTPETLSAGVVKRATRLADGRDLFYFDDPGTSLGPERGIDAREPAARPATATMRRDVLTGDWISVAASRQNRVHLPPAEFDPLAPQTPTNPSEIPSRYDVAVFENKSPSFGPDLGDPDDLDAPGLGRTSPSIGRCEVVCFSPEHEGSFGTQSVTRARTAALSALPGIRQVFPFENRGEAIGVTLGHPHGQIYAYPYITPRTQSLLASLEREGADLFDRILDFERASERVILQGEHWTAFVPFAARWPLEVHLVPHRSVPDFAETTDAERDELAPLYLRLLRGVDALYDTPTPYIAAWHQAPVDTARDSARLHLQLTSPRRAADKLKFLAGSEAAMGAWIGDIPPETSAARLRDAVASFGHEPIGTWSAPGRANLIGEHTDYNDGFVLPFAIEHRTHVAVGRRDDGILRVVSTFDREPVEVAIADLAEHFPARRDELPEWARYPLGVAWALSAPDAAGLDLAFSSTVPIGAGLSSSAAIEGATASALDELWGLGLDRVALAQAGRKAENEAVGAPTGIMDQMASMLGRADAAIFLDCRTLDAHAVDLGFAAAGLALLVIDTGVKHSHATGGYGERRAACERGAAIMGVPALRDVAVADLPRAAELMDDVTFRRVRHIVTENQRVLDTVRTLREQGPTAIGELLVASHASMRDDFEISVPELDTAVEAALAAGAVGARMTGGGFGGAAIALVPQDLVAAVTDAARAAFASAGFAAPTIFTVTPSAGAGRDA